MAELLGLEAGADADFLAVGVVFDDFPEAGFFNGALTLEDDSAAVFLDAAELFEDAVGCGFFAVEDAFEEEACVAFFGAEVTRRVGIRNSAPSFSLELIDATQIPRRTLWCRYSTTIPRK